MAKGIKLPNGNRLSHGQLFTTTEGNPMDRNQIQRPLNSSMHRDRVGRDGRIEKRTNIAAPVPGMVRQTKPSHDFLHGSPIDDEPNTPLAPKSYEKPIAIHPGMTDKQRAALHPVANSAKTILTEASTLRPKRKA
jgi:hypothetical protein